MCSALSLTKTSFSGLKCTVLGGQEGEVNEGVPKEC
jgi:hypothetical protein